MSKKRKFRVYARVVGGTYLGDFEADTKEEAIERAYEEADLSMCWHCTDKCEDPQIEIEDDMVEELTDDE